MQNGEVGFPGLALNRLRTTSLPKEVRMSYKPNRHRFFRRYGAKARRFLGLVLLVLEIVKRCLDLLK